MDTALSSPKRARSDEPHDIPSPKRTCLDTSQTGPYQPKAEVSTPGTPFDDLDDLYGTPGESLRDSGTISSTGIEQKGTFQPMEVKRTFQLPGLGQSTNEQQQGSVGPRADSLDPLDARQNPDSSRERLDSSNGSKDMHATLGFEVTDGHQVSGLEGQVQKDDAQVNNEQRDTDVVANESSIALASTARTIPAEAGIQHAMPAGLGDISATHSVSRVFGTATDNDVILLSENLPPLAVDTAAILSVPQPTMGQISGPENAEWLPGTRSTQLRVDARSLGTMGLPNQIPQDSAQANKTDEQPEYEMDSSPIESSSSDSGSDTTSSSDDSEDYELLSPEEQARRLMQEDMGSDDEGAGKGGNGTLSGPLRTTNEKPDEVVPKPDLIVTPAMRIRELGDVDVLVENLALIKAKISGEYQVLETGSVLCLADRSVIGVVAETLGRVQQPYYSVRFTNAAAVGEAGLLKGTHIFYVEEHSTTVFTQPLKAYKGSDASNLHDEEVGDDEMEFSDDEKEAEYKRMMKQAKQARRDGKPADGDGFSRGPGRGRGGNRGRPGRRGGRPDRQAQTNDASGSINYDDVEADGPYTPLARPTNLHELMGRSEAPLEPHVNGNSAHEGNKEGRGAGGQGRGRGRGRGDRGRGGRGRGGQGGYDGNGLSTHRNSVIPAWNGVSQPQGPSYGSPLQQNVYSPAQYSPQQAYTSNSQTMQTPPNTTTANYSGYQQQHYAPQPYQSFQPQTAESRIPPGAFINPAFFSQSPRGAQYPGEYPFSPQ